MFQNEEINLLICKPSQTLRFVLALITFVFFFLFFVVFIFAFLVILTVDHKRSADKL